MTEPIRTSAPEGLKRLIKVSTFQHGTQFVPNESDATTSSVRNLIYELLRNQAMTAKELVGCVLSEPYSIPIADLPHIALALDSLNERGLLKVGFRVHNGNLEVEAVFQTLPLDAVLAKKA